MPESGVRPTSERVREAVFDILGGVVAGATVLDLYAGTGAYGLEALSRGAAGADFVEGDRAVAAGIEAGLRALGLTPDRARVHVADLGRGILPEEARGPFRLAFLDPPYEGEAGSIWLRSLSGGSALTPGGILVYERRRGPAPVVPAGLSLATERRYGDTTIAIYRSSGSEGPHAGGGT